MSFKHLFFLNKFIAIVCCGFWVLTVEAQPFAVFQQTHYQRAGMGVVVWALEDAASMPEIPMAEAAALVESKSKTWIESKSYRSVYQPYQAMTTASVIKLLTTATALEMLGPDHRFETKLAYEGKIENGVLKGNLLIMAGGDPTLGSEHLASGSSSAMSSLAQTINSDVFLDEWCEAIKSLGIKEITGTLKCSEGLFDKEAVSPYWIWEDLGNYYAAGVYDLAVFDNMYRLGLRSGKAGSVPEIRYVRPEMPWLQVDNHLVAKDNSKDSAYLYGRPYCWQRVLYGSIPAHRDGFEIKGDNPDPAAYLCWRLGKELQRKGVIVASDDVLKPVGEPSQNVVSAGYHPQPHVFYRNQSQPLSKIIRVVNEKSNNLYTEYLLRHIAMQAGYPNPVSLADGLQALRSYWSNKGLDIDSWCLYDACGLSPMTALSAMSMAQLLWYMSEKSPYADVFSASLPMAGKDGTVAGFGKSLDGLLRLKSGSMTGVKTYAGYWWKHQKKYVVVVMVNRANASGREIQQDIEQYLASLPL